MNSTGIGDWVFFGPYSCHIDRNIVVPEGEVGLLFMREFIRKNRREKKPGQPDFVSGFVGFISYEWQMNFVYVDKVFDLARAPGVFFLPPTQSVIPAQAGIPDRVGDGVYRSRIKSGMTKEQYFQKIQRIKEYLYAGDTYQVNFSQKFEMPFNGSAFALYQKLTQINPSPFQFFMETPKFAVISNSPERLFMFRQAQHDKKIIQTRPIKGTVPRGKTSEEDEANIAKLIASPKEAAELAMIVDLERNDIGKICVPGTVEVTENRTIEKYSHVIHTVANVRGVLVDQYDWYDALHALFPGGSVTGCPKKRTMEIINELEGEPRGIYCGSAGWIDLSGDCDFNILIRTLWLEKAKNSGIITFRSGGGIVVDSDPQKEYEETLHKAAAIANAICEFSY